MLQFMYMSDYIYPIYFELDEDETKLINFFRNIYKYYKNITIDHGNNSQIAVLERNLMSKYKARENKAYDVSELRNDCMVQVDNIVKIYTIDQDILDSLYTETERISNMEIKKLEELHPEYRSQTYCNIILESEDGKTVSGFTTQAVPIRISALMFILLSEKVDYEEIDINNPLDMDYLAALWLAGYVPDVNIS